MTNSTATPDAVSAPTPESTEQLPPLGEKARRALTRMKDANKTARRRLRAANRRALAAEAKLRAHRAAVRDLYGSTAAAQVTERAEATL